MHTLENNKEAVHDTPPQKKNDKRKERTPTDQPALVQVIEEYTGAHTDVDKDTDKNKVLNVPCQPLWSVIIASMRWHHEWSLIDWSKYTVQTHIASART